jgi:hypothetical protein
MSQSNRKLVGLLLMVPAIAVYSALATMLYEWLVAGQGGLVAVAFFAVAGMGFVVPGGWLIQWMSRPDEPRL